MILLLGCGAGDREPRSPEGDACPGTWQEALEATCHWMGPTCAYEEATCECSPHPHCGGATPEPPAPGDPGTYTCRTVDPDRPLLREDGCPLNMPATGDPCTGEVGTCTYAGCSWESWEATCTSGTWSVEDTYSGPLPM
jgi:hypothetical protein